MAGPGVGPARCLMELSASAKADPEKRWHPAAASQVELAEVWRPAGTGTCGSAALVADLCQGGCVWPTRKELADVQGWLFAMQKKKGLAGLADVSGWWPEMQKQIAGFPADFQGWLPTIHKDLPLLYDFRKTQEV